MAWRCAGASSNDAAVVADRDLASGIGLVRGLFPQPLRWSLHNILLFSLGIGAGAGVASCLYFLTLLTAGPSFTALSAAIGTALAIALALGFFARRKGISLQWAEGPAVPWYLNTVFVLACLLAVIMFLGAVGFNPHGEEGAWSIWNLRARFLFRAGAFWRDAFSSDLNWTHPDYPLLLPGLVALCWKLARQESTDAPIAIAFLFTLGTAGVLATTLGALRGKAYALLAGTLLLGTASFVALSAALYGDVPLSFYILAALALLCLQDRYPVDWRFSALAGLMAGFAAWTRNEGIFFVIAADCGSRNLRHPIWRSQGFASPATSLACSVWLRRWGIVVFFKLRRGRAWERSGISVPASTIFQHLADLGRAGS